jgi:hypothetical protein
MSQVEEFVGKFKLSNSQLKVVRDIFLEVGLVIFAGWTIGPIAVQRVHLALLILGLILSISLWYSSIKLNNYLNQYE